MTGKQWPAAANTRAPSNCLPSIRDEVPVDLMAIKPTENEIREFSIGDLSIAAGRPNPTTDFHVVRSHEAPFSEKLWRPSRSYHFSIVLILQGSCSVKSNLLQYRLEKNSLFIIPPGTIRQFIEKSEDIQVILIEFTKEFLGSAELHKKHVDAFTFFSSQSDPIASAQ